MLLDWLLVNTTELLQKALLKATGKWKTLTPADSKWDALLNIANIQIDTWAGEPYANWQSLYEPDYQVGTLSLNGTYELDEEVLGLSTGFNDYVRIKSASNPTQYYEFKTVPPEAFKGESDRAVARIGNAIRFRKSFTESSPELGGTILAPVFLRPEHLQKPNDEVPVDDPNWLVTMTAAMFALSKRNTESKYPLLIQEANALMAGMKANNEVQSIEVAREPVGVATEW